MLKINMFYVYDKLAGLLNGMKWIKYQAYFPYYLNLITYK